MAATDVTWLPPIGPAWLFATALLLICLAWMLCRQARMLPRSARLALCALRVAAILTVTLVLLNPSVLRRSPQAGLRPRLVVAVDTSRSFATVDVAGQSRLDAARSVWLAPAFLDALRERCDVRLYRYDTEPVPVTEAFVRDGLRAEGPRTCIAASLQRLLDAEFAPDTPAAGILLIGDGHETGRGDLTAAANAARQRGVPIWTVCLGDQRPVFDLAVTTTGLVPLFAGQKGHLSATLRCTGFGPDQANVTLLREGQVVRRQVVPLGARTVCEVGFDVCEDAPGLYEYEIRAGPLPGETETSNNARTLFARVTREKIRVLLLEGSPHWDTRFLADSLRADRQIELTSVVCYGPGRVRSIADSDPQATITGEAPTTAVTWTEAAVFSYDVIILGKRISRLIPASRLTLLSDYLHKRSGSIVFARGWPCDPSDSEDPVATATLAAIAPVEWDTDRLERLRIRLTPEGQTHPAFAFLVADRAQVQAATRPYPDDSDGGLAAFDSALQIRKERAATMVLARATPEAASTAAARPQAAIAYLNHGKGRVLCVLGDGLWRWRFSSDDRAPPTGPAAFDQFWRRMARWLVADAEFPPGSNARLAVSELPETPGATARIEVRLLHPRPTLPATLTATDPDGRSRTLPLDRSAEDAGLLRSTLATEAPGVYRVRLHAPSMTPEEQEVRFSVYEDSTEMIDSSADPASMRQLAEDAGGKSLDPHDPGLFLKCLAPGSPREANDGDAQPVWDRPMVLAGVIALLGAEWLLRRRHGLP